MHVFHTLLIVLLTGNFAFSSTYSKKVYKIEDYELLFEKFIEEYERKYENEQEKQLRFEIFKNNLVEINQLNSDSEHAVYGINMFTDYTKEELGTLQCYRGSSNDDDICTIVNDDDMFLEAEEDSFDWRDKSVVTPVKSQEGCSSCWAFSVTGNIESQYAIKNKKLITLSEQQLVDCDTLNDGCYGGDMATAMRVIIYMKGIMSETDYPYIGQDYYCGFNKSRVQVQLTDCKVFTLKDEEKLKRVLKSVGPLVIALSADRLHSYTKGIIDQGCPDPKNDHAVLLVGWGSENGVPYWILKNSWSKRFGEKGYFRLKRGINSCCIMLEDSITTAVL